MKSAFALSLEWDSIQEHEGGELDLFRLLPPSKVDQDWNHQGGEAQKESRNEEAEGHQRALLLFSRWRRR